MIKYRQVLVKPKHLDLIKNICTKRFVAYKTINLIITCLLISLIYSYVTKPSLSSYWHQIGREPLAYRTVGQQFEKISEKYGDREAIVSCYNQQRFTYQEVLDKV